MFPAEVFGVGVTVAELHPVVPGGELARPAGVVARPSRLGEVLPVALMTHQQKAVQLQRVEQVESALAAFKAELVVGLAADRPASDDRRRGQVGAASTAWSAGQLEEDISEFFAGVSDGLCKSCGPTLRPDGLGRSTLDVDDQRWTAVSDVRWRPGAGAAAGAERPAAA